MRISPDGKLFAFTVGQTFSSGGALTVAGMDGVPHRLGEPWSVLDGIVWPPSGRELWVSGEGPGRPHGIYAVPLEGPARLVWRGPGAVRLLDLDASGRALVARDEERVQTFAWRAGDPKEREVSWLDRTSIGAISRDGGVVVFTDRSSATEPGSAAYLRRLDGSLPARLGAGSVQDLSAGGRYALVQRGSIEAPRLVLVPTGAGQEIALGAATLRVVGARLFPDGKRLLIAGRDAADHRGLFVTDLQGSAVRSITPGKGAHYRNALSNDGRFAIGLDHAENRPFLYPTGPEGGPPRPVPGIDASEFPIGFSQDDRAVYVVDYWRLPPWKVFLVDLASGKRTLWREVAPSDPAGVLGLDSICIAPDGSAYGYSCVRQQTTLVLADGLR